MNRHDWIFVGIKLYGLYLIVQGLIALGGAVIFMVQSQAPMIGASLVSSGFVLMIGVTLFLGAPAIVPQLGKNERSG